MYCIPSSLHPSIHTYIYLKNIYQVSFWKPLVTQWRIRSQPWVPSRLKDRDQLKRLSSWSFSSSCSFRFPPNPQQVRSRNSKEETLTPALLQSLPEAVLPQRRSWHSVWQCFGHSIPISPDTWTSQAIRGNSESCLVKLIRFPSAVKPMDSQTLPLVGSTEATMIAI